MPLNIGELLGSYNEGMRALLRAAGLPEQMIGDPATGGTPAPAAPAAPAAAPKQSAADFLLTASKYLGSHKGAEHLLGGADPSARFQGGNFSSQRTVTPSLVGPGGLAGYSKMLTSGPHAGQQAQEYRLGGGEFAHVLFDPKTGKRQVFKFRRP